MQLPIENVKVLEEGKHIGIIKEIKYRTDPYAYTDLILETEGAIAVCGFPTQVSEASKLGKLLMKFGAHLEPGKTIDPDTLKGHKCSFVSIKDGKYTKVLPESVSPI